MSPMEQDIRPDPELAAALRAIEPEPPFDAVEWESLRSAIVARAELPLARRRSRSARLGRWSRQLVPLAAAASITLAVWFTSRPAEEPTIAEGTAVVAPVVSPEDVFEAELSEQEFRLLVSGRANADALLMVAVGES